MALFEIYKYIVKYYDEVSTSAISAESLMWGSTVTKDRAAVQHAGCHSKGSPSCCWAVRGWSSAAPGRLEPHPSEGPQVSAPLLSLLYCTEMVAITFSLQFWGSSYRAEASCFTVFAESLQMPVTAPVHALHFPGGSEIRLDCSTRVLDLTGSANTLMDTQP